jgi:hypothetical protein
MILLVGGAGNDYLDGVGSDIGGMTRLMVVREMTRLMAVQAMTALLVARVMIHFLVGLKAMTRLMAVQAMTHSWVGIQWGRTKRQCAL